MARLLYSFQFRHDLLVGLVATSCLAAHDSETHLANTDLSITPVENKTLFTTFKMIYTAIGNLGGCRFWQIFLPSRSLSSRDDFSGSFRIPMLPVKPPPRAAGERYVVISMLFVVSFKHSSSHNWTVSFPLLSPKNPHRLQSPIANYSLQELSITRQIIAPSAAASLSTISPLPPLILREMFTPINSKASTNEGSPAASHANDSGSTPAKSTTEVYSDGSSTASDVSVYRSPSPETIRAQYEELIDKNQALAAEVHKLKERNDEAKAIIKDQQKELKDQRKELKDQRKELRDQRMEFKDQRKELREHRELIASLVPEGDGEACVAFFRGLYDRIEALQAAAAAHDESHDCRPLDD